MGKTRNKLNQLRKKLWGPCRVASEQPTSQPASRSTGSVTSFLITDKSQPSNTKLSSDITVLPPAGAGNTTDHAEPPSKRLWHAAFDSLENGDEEIEKYVARYKSILQEQLGEDDGTGSSKLNQLDDPCARQAILSKYVEKGREKIQNAKSAKLVRVAGNISGFILEAEKLIDTAVRSVPQAALPWAGVCLGLQILSNPMNEMQGNLEGIVHVVSRMKWYCALTDHVSVLRDDYTRHQDGVSGLPEGLEDAILTLYREVLRYQIKSVCSYYNNQGINFARNLLRMDDWHGLLRAVMNAEQTLQTNLTNCHYVYMENAVDKMSDSMDKIAEEAKNMKDLLGDISLNLGQFVTKMMSDNKADECLQSFYVMNPTADKDNIENRKGGLLDGISDWIFETKEHKEFINWATPLVDNPAPRLMWIRGEPGTGKTMLLMTIINKFSSNPPSLSPGVCYFFCQGIEKDLRDATTTLRCLVWQLLIQQPDLITHVQEIHRREGSAAFQGSSAFFAISNAFKSMLKDENLSPMYFVVDALDECKQSVADLRNFILDSLKICSRIKWLVSSRPSIQLQPSHVIHLDKDRLTVPVATFIRHKLSTLKEEDGYNDNILTEIKREVSEKAENTFLWVALALAQLDKRDPSGYAWHGAKALEIIRAMPSGLTKLYDHILARIESEYDADECKQLLAAAAFAYRPLALSDLDLFDVPEDMHERIIKKCSSFLTLKDKTLYPVHQSAKEYLDRTFKSKLQPDRTVPEKHWDIGRRSIEKMSSILNKRNIYDIEFGTEAKDIKPKDPDPLQPVRYACVFWADHICLVNDSSEVFKEAFADDGLVHVFLRERLLFWLESLALMGQLPKGVSSTRELHRFVQSYNPSGRLVTFLVDVVKFVNKHVSIIRRAPLQAYTTALVFSPRSSEVVKSQWQELAPFIKASTGHQDHWDEHLQTLECDANAVFYVKFLPDDMTLVATTFGAIWVWDVNTWTLKMRIEAHECIVFLSVSNSGKYLATIYADDTVGIWDVNTWAHRILEPCPPAVKVAFSADSMTLAVLTKNSISFWDLRTWTHKQTIEVNQLSQNRDVSALSSDGRFLATPELKGEIQISDAKTGAHLQTLQGHRRGCGRLEFSPDSMTLASGSSDGEIRLWDTRAWANRLIIGGFRSCINSFAFSHNGLRLAAALADSTVRVWDVNTGSLQQLLRGHNSPAYDLAFSRSNKMLASASIDWTIRIWDTNTTNDLTPTEDDQWAYESRLYFNPQQMAFSIDGTKLVSSPSSGSLHVWDAERAICMHKLEGHRYEISAVTFSADNSMLASGDDSALVMIWDTDRRTCRTKFRPKDYTHAIYSLAFSPNGTTLALATRPEIMLWDMNAGAIRKTVRYDCMAASMAFISDSLLLVSDAEKRGSLRDSKSENPCTVYVWDTSTEAGMQTFKENFEILHYCFPSRTMHPKNNIFLTTIGSIPLSSLTTAVDQSTDQLPTPRNLYIEKDGWIVLNGQRILWLALDNRATSVAIYDNRIVLRHRTGDLTFLTLRLPIAD